MYYIEREIEGKWYYKVSPSGEWIEFSNLMLCDKIRKLEKQLNNIANKNE